MGRDGPVAILAGGGTLPAALAQRLESRGREVRLLAFRGFAERNLERQADHVADLLDVDSVLAALARWQPACVVLAGSVSRPRPLAVLNAFSAYRNRQHIADLMASGDDRLLGAVVRLLEERGFPVAAIKSLAPELLARPGVMGACAPAAAVKDSIARGLSLLETLSSFDMGQAAVIIGARVIAVEGPEGTDAMLDRVRQMWRDPRAHKLEEGGVLVKTAKAGQDFRVDMPVIGPRTMAAAAAARLAGVAVGAGATLILDEARTIAEADRRGLFLLGVGPAEPMAAP